MTLTGLMRRLGLALTLTTGVALIAVGVTRNRFWEYLTGCALVGFYASTAFRDPR